MTNNSNYDTAVTRAVEQWDAQFDATIDAAGNDIRLSSGLSGYLMLEYALYRREHSEARRGRINAILERIVDALEQSPQEPGLWTGLLGPLYAVEYLRRNDSALVAPELCEFVDSMDEYLIAATMQPAGRLHYDLVMGLCGFGAYALMRTDARAAAAIYRAVEVALQARAVAHGDGLAWYTPPRFASIDLRDRGEYLDFGVAHGVGGVIGLMAGAVRVGIHTADTLELAQMAMRGLRRHELPEHKLSTFPTVSPEGENSSRLAWCYGDLGIGCAVLLLGEAAQCQEIVTYAKDLLRKRFASPPEKYMISDSGLCHGHAGLWRMADRIAARTTIAAVDTAGRDSLRTLLARNLAAQVHDRSAGFLDGHAGILMALVMADISEVRPWDTCMNFGF